MPYSTEWRRALLDALWTGTTASVISAAAMAVFGGHRDRDAARPLNGPSQWVWGLYAPHVRGFSVKHTVTGYAIHHAMSVFWAFVFESFRPRRPGAILPTAAILTTAAYVIDFHLIPRRLSPGFDVALRRRDLFATYACFALGLAAGAFLRDRRRTTRLQMPRRQESSHKAARPPPIGAAPQAVR